MKKLGLPVKSPGISTALSSEVTRELALFIPKPEYVKAMNAKPYRRDRGLLDGEHEQQVEEERMIILAPKNKKTRDLGSGRCVSCTQLLVVLLFFFISCLVLTSPTVVFLQTCCDGDNLDQRRLLSMPKKSDFVLIIA